MNKKRAQSILDYVALMTIVAISVAAMWKYVMGSVNARMAHLQADYFNIFTHPR